MDEYPRPWHVEYHLTWWIVDANGNKVAGPFGNSGDANEWLRKWPNPTEKEN